MSSNIEESAVAEGSVLYHNGHFVSSRNAVIEESHWLLVAGGVVREVGVGDVPSAIRSERQHDLLGRVVFPGLWDSHIHVYGVGTQLSSVDLEGCASITELQDRTRQHLQLHGHATYLQGSGWDQALMGRIPTCEDLDACVGDVPAIFYRRCFHVCVLNSAALVACGITAATADVDGGVVDRRPDGTPTGVLREAAMDVLLSPLLDVEVPTQLKKDRLWAGLQACVQRGITAVQTNDCKDIGNISDAYDVYHALDDEKALPCRVFLTVGWKDVGSPGIPTAGSANSSGRLSCDRAKIWTDGALGASTAALLEPYSDADDGNVGVLQMTPQEIDTAIQKVKFHGFRVEAHAIGDRAAKHLLQSFERHLESGDRPVLTHCQILTEDLVAQMARSGTIANIQPQFVPSDLHVVRARLGEGERLRWSYAWKTLLSRGVALAGGSDAPVEAPAPLVGMADAMDHVLHDHERLSFAEALEMYTRGAAFAARAEDRLGGFEQGMGADFVVLDYTGPVGTISSADLRSARVEQVYVQGREVFSVTGMDGVLPPPTPYVAGTTVAGKAGLLQHWRRGRCPCCR